MLYYAKVNTASPATGLIRVGEYLTKRQAASLGEEKLRELVAAGVLGADRSTAAEPSAPLSPAPGGNADAPEDETPDEAADAPEDDADELPELGDADDVVSEDAEEQPAAAKPDKKGAKRK